MQWSGMRSCAKHHWCFYYSSHSWLANVVMQWLCSGCAPEHSQIRSTNSRTSTSRWNMHLLECMRSPWSKLNGINWCWFSTGNMLPFGLNKNGQLVDSRSIDSITYLLVDRTVQRPWLWRISSGGGGDQWSPKWWTWIDGNWRLTCVRRS